MVEGDEFLSFLPKKITNTSIIIDMTVIQHLESTMSVFGKLEGLFANRKETNQALIQLLESTISSQIEGTSATPEDVLVYRDGLLVDDPTAALASQNFDVVEWFREIKNDLTVDDIEKSHAILFKNKSNIGCLRKQEVWLRPGDYPASTRYVAPHYSQVDALLTDLLTFNRDKKIPSLLRAVISHAQFELIHPFTDGNGRIGRALLMYQLEHTSTINSAILLLSRTIRNQQSEYNSALQSLSEGGDWNGWCNFFLPLLKEAGSSTISLLQDIEKKYIEMKSQLEKEKALANEFRLLELAFVKPWLNSKNVRSKLKVSSPTANRLLRRFEAKGWMAKSSSSKRSPMYHLIAFTELLSFAEQ